MDEADDGQVKLTFRLVISGTVFGLSFLKLAQSKSFTVGGPRLLGEESW